MAKNSSTLVEFVRGCIAHLPTVVFLTSVCVLLHHSTWYAPLEFLSLRPVATFAPSPWTSRDLGKDPEVVAVVLDSEFFETAYRRTLPLDRKVTADVFTRIAAQKPRLIALDIDATPASDSQADVDAAAALRGAVSAALDQRIDVVLTTFARQSAAGLRAQEANLAQLCSLATASPDGVPAAPLPERGRLVVTSPMMQRQDAGFDMLVARTETAEKANSHRFAQAVAVLGRSPDERGLGLCECLSEQADDRPEYCEAGSQSNHKADVLVRFIDEVPVLQKRIGSETSQAHGFEDLKGRIVLLGAESFEGLDMVSTAVGQMPGVLASANIANTLLRDPALSKRFKSFLSFVFDVVIGLALVAGFRFVEPLAAWLRRIGTPGLVRRALVLLLPATGLIALMLGVLMLSGVALASGIWVDPVPIALGLLLHVYADLVDDNRRWSEPGPQAHHGLGHWFHETWSAWRGVLRWRQPRPGIDLQLLAVWRLVMAGCVLAAVYSIFH